MKRNWKAGNVPDIISCENNIDTPGANIHRNRGYINSNPHDSNSNDIPSLCELFNRSVLPGTIPEEWKSANIVPVYKKGDKEYTEDLTQSTDRKNKPIPTTYSMKVFALESVKHERSLGYCFFIIII